MKKSRLVHIFQTLTKKEIRDLRKWLHSPAHNQREDSINLFEYLVTEKRLEKDRDLEKEVAFFAVYPELKTFDDAKMRQAMYFLLKSTEEFLIYEELRTDKIRTQAALISIFRKRELWKYCEQTIKSVKDKQEQSAFRDSRHFRNSYIIEREEYRYTSGNNRISPNLQEMSDALDVTFIADKMRQMCLMLTHQKVYKTEYAISFKDLIIKEIESNNLTEYPAIALYYYIYKMLIEGEHTNWFESLKSEINKSIHLFKQSEQRDLYLAAINYCIQKMNSGESTYMREVFDLYREAFEQEILFENGLISRWTFLNVMTISSILKEYRWAEAAIEKYQYNIEEQYRENTVHYASAKLKFEQKDYDAAMDLLIQYEYDEILMNLNAKSMLLKIYYEREELTALEALIGSMRTYLNRKKMMSYHKGNFKNFLKMLSKLNKINPYSKAEKEKLRMQISNINPIIPSEKKWLLTQLNKI